MNEPTNGYATCPSKVAWPVWDEHWANVTCSLPLNHPGPRDHQGVVRGFARGQQEPINVIVCWTRPPDASAEAHAHG